MWSSLGGYAWHQNYSTLDSILLYMTGCAIASAKYAQHKVLLKDLFVFAYGLSSEEAVRLHLSGQRVSREAVMKRAY
jgi:hypothetical protein